MVKAKNIEGRFYRFKPLPNSVAKDELQVDFLYRQHPVIVFARGRGTTVWVVTVTSHPHFDDHPSSNFMPIHPTLTDGGSYDKPLTMKEPKVKLPKNSWVVIDSRKRVPKDSLEGMMHDRSTSTTQYALDQRSINVLRKKIDSAIAWQKIGKQRDASAGKDERQARKSAAAAAKTPTVGDKGKGRCSADHQALMELEVQEMKKSIAVLEHRLDGFETLWKKLQVEPLVTSRADVVEEQSAENQAQLIEQEIVRQISTPMAPSSTGPAAGRKRDSMKDMMSRFWSKMGGTSSPSVEDT